MKIKSIISSRVLQHADTKNRKKDFITIIDKNYEKSTLLEDNLTGGLIMFIGGVYIATGVIAWAAKYAANALGKKMGL